MNWGTTQLITPRTLLSRQQPLLSVSAGADVPAWVPNQAWTADVPRTAGGGDPSGTMQSLPVSATPSSTGTALVHEGEMAAASYMLPMDFSTFDNAAYCTEPNSGPCHAF